MRTRRTIMSVLAIACASLLHARTAPAAEPNLLPNGGFEESSATPDAPEGWVPIVYAAGPSLTWNADASREGIYSAKIEATTPNDAAWEQSVVLTPNRNYLLSGWIKTENVTHTTQAVDAGANLCLMGTWIRTPALTGTNDWTYVRTVFNSGDGGRVTIGARIGYWAGVAGGTAWFDDIRITELTAEGPHPAWKVLVLIYGATDFTYSDASGTHRLIGHVPAAQVDEAAEAAARFVRTDIPALASRLMVPELTIRRPGTLSRLSLFGNGWWPSPADTAAARDPAYDSVIVIWQPTVTDQLTGQLRWIGNAAGLTPPMGTDQTYTTLIIEAATRYGHRNVFKHEWGHSILWYFDAAGTAPRPTVQNHTDGSTYVNCETGQYYVWLDETDANPIQNSIYNNASGFTHDYYSGTTALASDPLRCLGVTGEAWATGGPVTRPGEPDVLTPGDRILDLRTTLARLVANGALREARSRALETHLDQAGRSIGRAQTAQAVRALEQFRRKVQTIERGGELSSTLSGALRRVALEAMRALQ